MEKAKRVFLVHGWDGRPDNHWFPWIKRGLEGKGFRVESLKMPNPGKPEIEPWVNYLAGKVGETNQNTFLIGHSIGCQTIMRFLEKLSEDSKIGGVVFVGGFFTLANEDDIEEDKSIARPWLETRIDTDKLRRRMNKFIAIFSDDDPVIPLNNKKLFEERLGAKTIVEHNKGHFCKSDGVTELPSVLNALLEISGFSLNPKP